MVLTQGRSAMRTPTVSIVVTTKNAASHLDLCLRGIRNQTYAPIELIVVDNRSTDRTLAIARQHNARCFSLGPERSAQRNLGLRQAAGEFAMYLDADMIPAPGLVGNAVQFLQQAQERTTAGLYVSEIVLGKGMGPSIRRFERSFYDGTVVDAARFFRRDAFLATAGFDESLNGPEDWDFDKQLKKTGNLKLLPAVTTFQANDGKQKQELLPWAKELAAYVSARGVRYDPHRNAIFHDEAVFSVRKYLSKKAYYADSFARYIAKYGHNDADIKKQFGPYYRMCGIFIENGKWRKLPAHPFLTVGMLSLRFQVAAVYLFAKLNPEFFRKKIMRRNPYDLS